MKNPPVLASKRIYTKESVQLTVPLPSHSVETGMCKLFVETYEHCLSRSYQDVEWCNTTVEAFEPCKTIRMRDCKILDGRCGKFGIQLL